MKLLTALSLVALLATACAATPQTAADRLPGVSYPGLICRATRDGGRCMSHGQWVIHDRQASNSAQTAAERPGPQRGPTIDGW
jgi:hypothetical protein